MIIPEFSVSYCIVNRSTVFEAMFTHDMTENRSSRVCIEDLDPDTVYDMISYIYSGRVGLFT